MAFPFERYKTLAGTSTFYYPEGQEVLARQILQLLEKGETLLEQLLALSRPEMEVLLVAEEDWKDVPLEDREDWNSQLPYWTDETEPSLLVIPVTLDAIIGEPTEEKLALLLFHELTHAFLEHDTRPWPEESPLWADEWQLQFAAFWLLREVYGQTSIVHADLREQNAELFEPEADGKTPVTVRGFDWYEDTTPEDYLEFALLLEQFALDLLGSYGPEILPRFLERYRKAVPVLLSDDVTEMLAIVLGPEGSEWLENLVYF